MKMKTNNLINNFKRWMVLPALTALVLLAGCSRPGLEPTAVLTQTVDPDNSIPSTSAPLPTVLELVPTVIPSVTPIPEVATFPVAPVYGYTHQRPDGNRYLTGSGAFPDVTTVDIPLDGVPVWLVAAQGSERGIWVAVLADGSAQAFSVGAGGYVPIDVIPDVLPPGMPPLLEVAADSARLIVAPGPDASTVTAPGILDPLTGRLAYVAANGDLVIWENGEIGRLPVDALPDARLLVDEIGRVLFLAGPTDRYDHGVLGDGLEATAITLVETTPELRVLQVIPIDPPGVVEGLAPIWADLNGDGRREIIVTRSDAERGAQILVFDELGEVIAAGPSIGRGYRWRNQLAVAPFGPSGEIELVDVLTPHIGGVVEFYEMNGDRLEIIAQVAGYTSHVIGTRNLDMGLSADFNGDGRIEAVLPNQGLDVIGALQRVDVGASQVWRLPLEGRVSTNLAAVAMPGGMALGVGRDDGVLRVWLSE
jgi:hypothetical protein